LLSETFDITQSSACGDKLVYDDKLVMTDKTYAYDIATANGNENSFMILGMKSSDVSCSVTC